MNSLFVSIIRTIVPWAVGALIALLLTWGIEIPTEVVAETTLALTTLSTSLYYIIVRTLEQKVPAFGWLLGVAKSPVYSADKPAAPAAE